MQLINEFYLGGGRGDLPLGHVQMCGKITPPMVQGIYSWLPEYPLKWLCSHSVDWFLVTEDLPVQDNRLIVDSGDRIRFELTRPNYSSHVQLVQKMKERFKRAGYRWIISKPFDYLGACGSPDGFSLHDMLKGLFEILDSVRLTN